MLTERVQEVLRRIEALDADEKQSLVEYLKEQERQDAEAASGETDLTARGISQEQAEELRAGMQPFAEDWESEEMSIYDDYDAAKSRL